MISVDLGIDARGVVDYKEADLHPGHGNMDATEDFMGEYLITIELHGASADDYKTLHEAMCDVGFHRLIVINEHKRRLVLPIAIYRGWSLLHLEEVLAAVKAAANATVRLNKVYCALVAASSTSFDEF